MSGQRSTRDALGTWWLIQEAREHLHYGGDEEKNIADGLLVEAQVELIGDGKSIDLWNERRGV